MISLNARCYCDNIRCLLTDSLETKSNLLVHSIFTHACNLMLINLEKNTRSLITLGTRDRTLAPSGIILELSSFELLKERALLKKESLFKWEHNKLVSDQLIIYFDDAIAVSTYFVKRYDSKDRVNLTQLTLHINQFLKQSTPLNGIYAALNFTEEASANQHAININRATSQYITPEIDNLKKLLINTQWLTGHLRSKYREEETQEILHNILNRLIGLGSGLTPSGDDFILGILLVLFYFDDSRSEDSLLNIFIKALQEMIHKTGDISQQMLINASHGHFSLLLMTLFVDDLSKVNNSEYIILKLKELSNYGHSSGHDTLSGVAFALTYLQQVFA